MWSRIPNRENLQRPEFQNDSVEEHDFSDDFDPRAKDDSGIISSHEPKSIGQFIKKLIQSARENISNWFQSASDYIKNKFTDSQASRALTNVRQHPALSTRQDIKEKSVTIYENSRAIDFSTSGYPDIQDENFGKKNQGENFGKITSENIQNNEKYLEDFENFKRFYGKYKNGELNYVDNFKTENAKKYASNLIKNGEKNLANDPNYFFKNIAEYKDIVIASDVLDTTNKFALANPLKDQEENFQRWVISKNPEAFAKLRASEPSFSVNLDQAKIYADWVVFQNLIGELPQSVDQSIILLATELRDMMESAKAETTKAGTTKAGTTKSETTKAGTTKAETVKVETAKVETAIESLNDDVKGITEDLMAFFEEPTPDEITPVSPSSTDQRPVTSVKSAGSAGAVPKPAVSSGPPPPPPPPPRVTSVSKPPDTKATPR